MKKVIALILVLMMVLTLAACGEEGDATEPQNTDGTTEPQDTEGATEPQDTEGTTEPQETEPPVQNTVLTDDELVEKLAAICEGKTGEMPVETTSFEKLAADGFETAGFWGNWFNGMAVPEGALIAVNQPMMGQAHVVLLIQPAEGQSAEDLLAQMKDNANPNWMICMTADSVDSAVKDGLVLFVMTSTELGLNAQSFIDAFNA